MKKTGLPSVYEHGTLVGRDHKPAPGYSHRSGGGGGGYASPRVTNVDAKLPESRRRTYAVLPTIEFAHNDDVTKQSQQRPLTPIEERDHAKSYLRSQTRRRSSTFTNVAELLQQKAERAKEEHDFYKEVSIDGVKPQELRVVVGRTHIKLIGTKDGRHGDEAQAVCHYVGIPSTVDPLTVRTAIRNGRCVITAAFKQRHSTWALGRHGLMTVSEAERSARVTVDIPPGYSADRVQARTVTKHYVIVTAVSDGEEEFLEQYELPAQPAGELDQERRGDNTLVINVPLRLSPD